MADVSKLTKGITEKEFDNGYWYADEIKAFAKQIGITNSSKLRKDELEQLIKHFLRTGQLKNSDRKNIKKKGLKDLDIGLTTFLPIIHYTSNKQTKIFVKTEAQKIIPDLTIKSGVWYRLNRWREQQTNANNKITYGDLINQYIKLNQNDEKFEKVPVGRYINFISEYLANEKGATRQQAIEEWKKLKNLDMEKDYQTWKRHQIK